MAESERRFTQLVVVGASAGGIEALSSLVSTLPTDFPAPIVVAQHISPNRASSLAEILSKRGTLPVRTVTGQERLDPGVIFVVPPNRDVVITDHEVRVQQEDGTGPRPSIDRLFASAAEVFGEELIAVILSGTGSDGSAGAREVKHAGGTVVIQNPDTAAFPSMPLSLAPSTVDIVADPDGIGPVLHDLLTSSFVVPPPTADSQLRSFLDQIRDDTGIDFSTYKPPTIMRRLQRRMAATGQSTLADYIRHVRQHPEERQRLIASFLIKVTEFFRDPELYVYLREHVLPELIAKARERDGELRLWSAGCATGEEAYSLAMLVAEMIGDGSAEVGVRIFATDLDVEAVAYARHGVYPARALTEVPRELIDRYFTLRNGEYEVNKTLRSLLVFGEHDLGQRAPFPHIDLVLCRNVLIYFTAALQRRALQLFAFSLRASGYLVLGTSETIGSLAEYFAVDQPRLKVFRRVGDRAIIPAGRVYESIPTPTRSTLPPAREAPSAPRPVRLNRDASRLRSGARAEDILLSLPIGVVVVDANYDVQSINTVARRMFGIHTGAIDRDFLHLMRHFPSASIRAAIDDAMVGKITTGLVLMSDDDEPARQTLEIACYPLRGGDDESAMTTVVATDVTAREQLLRDMAANERLVQRLTATNDEVLGANQDLTGTITKLRAENEDLLVATEEVQAATEEVETLNEELQASNEELETLNEELQATVEELNATNDDLNARTVELHDLAVSSEAARARLEALLGSISDAVLVVDGQGGVVLSNVAYDRIFDGPLESLALEDEAGRPLPTEAMPHHRGGRGETFAFTFAVTAADGTRRWYEALGRPVPPDGSGQRGVVTIRDITERSLRHMQEQWLAIASHELRTPLAALQGALQLALRVMPAKESVARSRRYLDQALTQTRRVGTLIEQMVEATRIQQERLVLDRERVDLAAVAERAVETASVLTRGQTITLDADGDDMAVTGDATRLEQVLLNLLINAINYAPDTERIDVRLGNEDEAVVLNVRDYGRGIPDHELAMIFERFRRGEHRGQAKRGLGLGLFIAREVITGHGGTIAAQSTVGEGTTFTIRLPRFGSTSMDDHAT